MSTATSSHTSTSNGMEPFDTELSKEYEKLEGTGPEPYAAYQALKEKIKLHYDIASDYYLSLWGEHIHHGYFMSDTQSKEDAQTALITLLLDLSSTLPKPEAINGATATTTTTTTIPSPPKILDVGCGVGGTSRHLAREYGAQVTGITISSKQVEIARRLSLKESSNNNSSNDIGTSSTDPIPLGSHSGTVSFHELDAEKMGDFFASSPISAKFDIVWISEALSHFPNKKLFFQNAFKVLKDSSSTTNGTATNINASGGTGKLVIADWFKAEDLTEKQFRDDIQPIEAGMLLPPLCTAAEYVKMAEEAGFRRVSGGSHGNPMDISKEVAKTWDISWSLVQNPSLWAFAFSQGRDGIAFLQAFRAMRRGYANGTFRYAVMAFEK